MINIHKNYNELLKNNKPIRIGHSNHEGLADIGGVKVQSMTIAPVNTNINFDKLPAWNSSDHPGLSAIEDINIPKKFNWRYDQKKGGLISKPGNQMLCGSCWATAAAGIIGDNFVVSNIVDWLPDLSTTWILANYPQLQCGGGNPAAAFEQIRKGSLQKHGGLVNNHCVDYSWCATNSGCNGQATKHLDNTKLTTNQLNNLIPKNPGCYCNNSEHLLYKLTEPVYTIAIGKKDQKTNTVISENDWNRQLVHIKKHILLYGPVLGGFLVFNNFMNGVWTDPNGPTKGIYLENGIYNTNNVHFDPLQTDPKNFKGSHAVAIIGWGEEDDVIIDNNGTRATVQYWYCRNSWTEKWGKEGGYFKIAMYPHNKIAQFDKSVIIKSPKGNYIAGGIVLITASEKPKLEKFDDLVLNPNTKLHTIHSGEDFKKYYCSVGNTEKPIPPTDPKPDSTNHKKMNTVILLGIFLLILFLTIISYIKLFPKNKYIFITFILIFVLIFIISVIKFI